MNQIINIASIFSILVFIHFASDWLFQSHDEAMAKTKNALVRAKHCLVYSVLMIIPIWFMGFHSLTKLIISFGILFLSHFVEDSYIPVFYWAKYIRNPPEMRKPNNAMEGFIKWVETPLGKILLIAVDQIIHIFFVLIVSWIVVSQ